MKLLGEDSHDPKLLKNKRSFVAKKPSVRLLIITAGVIMNFLLAFVLLTIGFTFGIQPLIVDADDFFENLNNGTIQTAHGVLVETVEQDGIADLAGLQEGDRLVAVNGEAVLASGQVAMEIESAEQRDLVFDIEREGAMRSLHMVPRDGEDLGFSTFQIFSMPHPVVGEMKEGSVFEQSGLQPGDAILKVNDQPVYFLDQYSEATAGISELEYLVFRDSQLETVQVILPEGDTPEQGIDQSVFVDVVYPDTPAEKAGLEGGDIIVSVNGKNVVSAEQLIALTGENASQDTVYQVRRDGELTDMTIQPTDNGLIGVGLPRSEVFHTETLALYASDVPVSILSIADVKYPVWIAPLKALEETGRLSLLTLDMLGDVVRSVVTQLTVPEGVAGPVGIARLTHQFVQEGILSVLRFMALLSLSLAIINIFPFPALDGGRAFFILVEVIFRRRISGRFEALIHAAGFLVLMGLIFLITYNDILQFF